jgi:hypothetical protein
MTLCAHYLNLGGAYLDGDIGTEDLLAGIPDKNLANGRRAMSLDGTASEDPDVLHGAGPRFLV